MTRHRRRHSRRRAAAPVRALPPRRGRAVAHARRHRHRPGAGAGAGAAARRRRSRVDERASARGTTFTVAIPLGTRAPAGGAHRAPRALASTPRRRRRRSSTRRCAGCRARADRAEDAPAQPIARRRAPSRGARILLADDNADMRDYLRAPARAALARSRRSPTASAALAAARAQPPDLVLTDVMMPRLDGFGLLRALRADPRTARRPGHPAVGARRRGGARRGPRGRRRRLPGQAVLRARAARARRRRSWRAAQLRARRGRSSATRLAALFVQAPGRRSRSCDGPEPRRRAGQRRVLAAGRQPRRRRQADSRGAARAGRAGRLRAARRRVRARGEPLRRDELARAARSTDDGALARALLRLRLPAAPRRRRRASTASLVVCVRGDRAGRRAQRASEANREAETANRAKDEFLAMLGHELRNPLAPILTALQLMRLRGGDARRARARR